MRFLDRGVQGIIVPHVNTREAAEAVARAARYHPDGHRGVGRWTAPRLWGRGLTGAVDALDQRPAPGDSHDRRDRSRGQPGRDSRGIRGRRAARRVRRSRSEHGQSGCGGGPAAHAPGRSQNQGRGQAGRRGWQLPGRCGRRSREFIKLGANFVTISSLGLLRLGAEDFRQRVQCSFVSNGAGAQGISIPRCAGREVTRGHDLYSASRLIAVPIDVLAQMRGYQKDARERLKKTRMDKKG